MTDREIAQQVAEEIIRLRNRVDAMETLLSRYQPVDREGVRIPWRRDLLEVEVLEEYRELVHNRSLELAGLFDGEEGESSPFRAVWKKYCQPPHR